MKKLLAGFTFAALWGSGAMATKLGIKVVQPFLLINARFLLAALLMLGITLGFKKERLPKAEEWKALLICGILSMGIYPTAFVFAMKNVTAGIGTLGSAACPLLISVLNALWLRQKISWQVWLALLLGLLGVATAIYPLLLQAQATLGGVMLLALSMLCYAIGTVYYQRVDWQLTRMSINGWQVLVGGVCLLPFTLIGYQAQANTYQLTFYLSVFWLVVPISIIAVQIWLYLLKAEPTKASLWLFLCPIFGFLYSNLMTHEPITLYTIIGTSLVLIGLYIGKR